MGPLVSRVTELQIRLAQIHGGLEGRGFRMLVLPERVGILALGEDSQPMGRLDRQIDAGARKQIVVCGVLLETAPAGESFQPRAELSSDPQPIR
jgi:hypothetical protein